ncbi:MAG TPA: MFS transporter [Blastocatellia bacterium]|jgi:MFS family permease|nr:MFS transporter [Blastocatellia bacterium]
MAASVDREARQGARPSLSVFFLVWLGQVVSLMGSGLTAFALGVWVFQMTGSTTQYSFITVCSRLPGIVVAPIAGALIDRWDRRWAMILSDVGAGLSILGVALLYLAGVLEVWHICVALIINSTLSAFQWPAYSAATTMLVHKKHYGRAAGMIQTGEALGYIVSPVLGGVLLITIQLHGVFFVDFATFLFSILTLFLVRIPSPPKAGEAAAAGKSLLREAAYGWRYITSRPGLTALLVFFAAANFLGGFILVLTTPMVLAFASASVLGTVLSIGGSGMLFGGLVMSTWGGPRRRIHGVLGFQLLSGLSFILAGLRPSAALVAVAAFFFFFSLPFINGSSQAIWQVKIPTDVQGRVFAVRRMIAWSSVPLAYLSAGPLAEYVFEPLLASGGPLAGSVGRVIGVGPGRGIGLLFIILGVLTLLIVCCGYSYPRLRLLEDEVGDMVSDHGPEGAVTTA